MQNIDVDEQAAKDDEDFNSHYSSLSKDSFNATLSSIDEEISPIKFQLRTPVESASSSTVQKLKRKLSQCITASTEYICDALAPGQADELMKLLLSEDNQKSDKVIPAERFSLVESYKSAPSQQVRYLILSLVPNTFSKTECIEFFGCSKYMTEHARKMKSESGPGVIPTREPFTRNRLNMSKVEHFIDFLIHNGYFQDVAYGTTKLKLDSGQEIIIPHIIRTSIKLHLVKLYNSHCSSIGYSPLSQSSLFKILDDCKTSQRKALTGVDNYTADGYEGFQTMEKILEQLPLAKDTKQVFKSSLKDVLMYLKGNYRLHVQNQESLCSTHCRTFALSNPKIKEARTSCKHDHSEICEDCQNLFFCLQSIPELIEDNVKDPVIKEEHHYEAEVASTYILEWMRHIIRGVHTQETKVNALSNLSEQSAWMVGDWMMKIPPQRYREKMEE